MYVYIKLDELLKKEGISNREFSRRTEIRRTTINDMCNNEVKQIPLDNLAKICEQLDVDIPDILELREGEKPNSNKSDSN